jgi:hypothetical protein
VNVPRVHTAVASSASALRACSGITVNSRYLEMSPGVGVGMFIDTTSCKRFVVRRDVEAGYGGLVALVCYDAAGARRASFPVKGYPECPFYYKTDMFGGSWQPKVDSTDDVYFSVAPEIAMVRVMVIGGTTALRIRSFSIYAVDNEQVTCWTGYEEIVRGAGIAIAPPPKGTYSAGKMVYNPAPKQGAPLGWVCVAGGTPGTWRPMGSVL